MGLTVRRPGEVIAHAGRRGFSLLLYGPPMVGKTSSLINDPNCKTCVVDLDKNTTTIEEYDNITIIGCDTFEDYEAVREGARSGVFHYTDVDGVAQTLIMDFDLYVIDSLTTLEEKIKKWVASVYVPNRKREIEKRFGTQSDWGDLQDKEIEEVRDWQSMTKRLNPLNVMWIGHDDLIKNDMGQAVGTQLLLGGNYAGPRIGSAVDSMFYMIKKSGVDPKNPKTVHRGVYTIDEGIIRADARMTIKRRGELPPFIWSPKWGEILHTMGYRRHGEE